MNPPDPQSFEIAHSSDGGAAQRAAKAMSLALGFSEQAAEEIGLTARELASNLVKHAARGTLTLTPLVENGRAGIEMESADSGPGIADVEEAMRDGFSTAGSLGCGLGAVNRLMDQVEIASQPGVGTRLVCRRWRRESPFGTDRCPLDIGVASRPHPKMNVNGDAFVIKQAGDTALVAVIDGLGHGPEAHKAAKAARLYVESHDDQPLRDIFRGVGRTCRATRGVVMALARFDRPKETLTFASFGNIEVRVLGSAAPINFVVRRGIVGVHTTDPVVTEHPWPRKCLLVLHSDGISTRWHWDDFAALADKPADVIAQGLLRALAKEEDDATVLVVRDALR